MILAIRTEDNMTRLWLLESSDRDVAKPALEWESGRQLADGLLVKITETLRDSGLDLRDLSGFIVFSGPGSFTSLRIVHSVANALADSLGVPVVGAMGENWLEDGLKKLAQTPPGWPALPHYGAEANITKPKT